jgi:serine/threonine-protein kinase
MEVIRHESIGSFMRNDSMRVLIAVIAGPHQGQVFTFTGHDTFLVGRSKRAHFRLPEKDEYFSRIHFLVEVNPPRCRLMDMKSTNGTYVNGKKVLVADLAHGDKIQAGQTVLQVTLEDEKAEPVTRRTPVEEPLPRLAREDAGQLALLSTTPPEQAVSSTDCRVCAAVAGAAAPASSQPPAGGWPLCALCREQIHEQPQPMPGYQLVRELGRGGMGVVYLALREADGTVLAVKTIKPAGDVSGPEVERFLREASILRQLEHPYIVSFREMGEANGQLYFAMDYVPGTDAERLLKQQGPWPIPRAVGLVCQLLEALDYAHSRGFVHRDVKPANLLVTQVAGREVVRLVDFGLARVYQASKLSGLTMAGQVGGTAPFMAPEQILHFREAKPAVDQYAAAATLYYLLTGQYIFDFPQAFQERLLLVLQEQPVPISSRYPEIPAQLADVVHRALAKEPAGRFADARTMRQRLLGCVAHLP